MKFRKFFLQRVLAWALTILIGVTFIFFIPRMFPSDPVENMIIPEIQPECKTRKESDDADFQRIFYKRLKKCL